MDSLMEALRSFQDRRPDKAEAFGEDIILAPQVGGGTSLWAQWMRDGDLEGWQVCWAYRWGPDHYRNWLALRVVFGDHVYACDLSTSEGQALQKKAEIAFAQFLKEKRSMDNKQMCAQAIELGLVKNSTEFWTKVKASGLTPQAWLKIAAEKVDDEGYKGERYPELDDTPFSDKTMRTMDEEKWDNLQRPGWPKEPEYRGSYYYGTLRISTSRIGHKAADDEMVVDVTVKTGLKTFAPSWDMVMGYKNGTMTKERYAELYTIMMEKNWDNNRSEWMRLINHAAENNKVVVLCCYCKTGDFCHRHILKRFLAEKAETVGYHGVVLPER